jgi:hypothetical protein
MEIDTLTTLNDQSSQELRGAVAAITAGDETATRYAAEVRQLVDGVNSASRQAAADAARLHADDVMNPDGKRRLLSELPGKLVADTRDQLDKAEIALDIVEGRHIERILHHDSRNDGALVAELQNYTAHLKPAGAVAAIVQLAANARYSTILAGPMGASLAARFNFDSATLYKTALESLSVNGNEDQVRRSAALAAGIPAARRSIGLARGGRDHVADQVQRAPKPQQQRVNALMP